jgi:Ca-activated chloride channel family protein
MNRTGVFLAAAGVLALVALVAGVPRFTDRATPLPGDPPRPVTSGQGSLSFTTRLSHPFVNLGQQDVFATVDVQGVTLPNATRAPVNLALVIDRSGSMSGFKLNQAKQAARQLISQLAEGDRLTLVHYGSDVKSMEGLMATASNKERLLAYVDGIWDDGGTNIGAGLTTARDLLLSARSDFKVNRLILISDGNPTEGVVEFEGLTSIVREIRGYGVSVSSIGVGEDFNEQLMAALAEVGAGAYAYLQDASQLAAIFEKDLNAAGTQVARGVTLTFRVPEGARFNRVLGYSQVSRRRLESGGELVSVSLPDFAAGQHERVVAHLSITGSAPGSSVDVAALELGYTDLLADRPMMDEARVAAMTTDQVEVVLQNRDKEAIVFANRARAADNAAEAAQRMADGDRAGAKAALQRNRILFDEAAAVAGPAAVQADVQAQEAFEGGLDSARGESESKQLQKQIRAKARKDYGLMGSTY